MNILCTNLQPVDRGLRIALGTCCWTRRGRAHMGWSASSARHRRRGKRPALYADRQQDLSDEVQHDAVDAYGVPATGNRGVRQADGQHVD